MYHPAAPSVNQKKDIRFSDGYAKRRSSHTKVNRKQEQVRLLQLLTCLVLFLVVFIGKGVFPTKLMQVRNDVLSMITSHTDFRAAFSSLGHSLAGEGTVLGEFGEFCVEVFGVQEPQAPSGTTQGVPQLTSLFTKESQFLSDNPDQKTLASHFFAPNSTEITIPPLTKEALPMPAAANPAEEVAVAIPAVGTILLKSGYSGQPLPARYTMDHIALGKLETITPVVGYVNSIYGYRSHPINGKYQFHGGLDISGQTGAPIKAFAAGTVEYVGKDDSYGLYLQLDHGNGIKSFYAHCSFVGVSKGQVVKLGENIAAVGSSGAATGPHLHLEVKYNKIHLDPTYYIEYLTDQ